MRTFSKWFVIAVFGAMLGLAGCDQQGPMEKAGEKVDNTVDDMTNQGPMEETGESLDDAADNTKDAASDMGDAMDGDDK
ncbi:hypothetical protein [Alloalcanivorax mobilis]|mgnify:FL=1|uniref:hypothetical protein n=1 Tax=Alloalcanivorax mobilis TaxID=2019569 RepID=UPI000B5B0FC7|nr:hypothetical protein [Alloalcanivorax mobilis]ASK35682.1 hypothetical protein CEK62_15475 [Alcanivorax sp. N3-2A]|tara:strand:- start:35412 stop:35648 length:237 start_codon:yes stop_codon:yes gene_type:complete